VNEWLSELSTIYDETYNKLFHSDRFRFKGKYIYKNTSFIESSRAYLSSIIHHYDSQKLEIINDDSIETEIKRYKDCGIISISSGLLFDRFLDSKTPYYAGVACLLYEGICKALDFEPDDLHISWYKIFGLNLFS